MTDSQHLVFGAGLIGGYIAGGLMLAGFNTKLRAREKVQQNMVNGLQLSDYLGHRKSLPPPQFVDSNNHHKSTFNFIWLTVKCTAVASAIKELRAFICPNTVVICCQNGLGSELVVRQAFPRNAVLRAVIGFNVTEPDAGHLHRSSEGTMCIEFDQRVQKISAKLNSSLVPISLCEDIRAEQWAKLQLNLANPINALADMPVKAMTEIAGYRKIIAALMDEFLIVSDSMQLKLPKLTAVSARWIPHILRLPGWIFKLVAQKMLAIDPTARTSMWWDLSANRKSEIDYLNGALVRQADKLDLDCPVNRRLVELVHRVEMGQETIGFSAPTLAKHLSSVCCHDRS